MAIDTPAKIAVLGAGPLGLEAALYARFLGYDVDIYERGRVAENVLKRGHARSFVPFGKLRSTLGLAAIEAHDESVVPPGDEEYLTGHEWVARYLLPLSQTDLLADHLRLAAQVLAVGKDELLKTDLPGDPERGDWDFRLLVRHADGREEIRKADAVLDATGPRAIPNWVGQGGIPAAGEMALSEQIEYGLPDVLGVDRERYAGRHTLVVGSGHSAATTVTALAKLAEEDPGTRVTWITRREPVAGEGPLARIPGDSLAERDSMAQDANRLAISQGGCVDWWPASFIDEVRRESSGQFQIVASGRHAGSFTYDQIVANVGYRSQRPCGELQTDTPEPNYYVLSPASHRCTAEFPFADGLARIREVFAIIGDRPNLDLYTGAQKLVRQASQA